MKINQNLFDLTEDQEATSKMMYNANQNIIIDMVGECVRVLTEGDEVVYTGTKTFMANIHDIRYELLENDEHRLSEAERTQAHKAINVIIDRVNDKATPITKGDFAQLVSQINMIGEEFVKRKLREMASELTII